MKILTISLTVVLAGILTVLSVFNPKEAVLPIFMAIFVLIYAFFCLLIVIIIKWAYPKLPKAHLIFNACVLAFCPVTLLALSSIGSLSFLDAILSIVIPLIIVWYSSKKSAIG